MEKKNQLISKNIDDDNKSFSPHPSSVIGNPIELRNDEINAILGRTPSYLVRNGIMIILGAILFIFTGTIFFSYPDVINCRVIITSSNPPIHLIAQNSGRIHQLLVTDGQKVKPDQLLAILENPADTKDILLLETWVDSMKKESIHVANIFYADYYLKLGDVTPYYLEFCKTLHENHSTKKSQLNDNLYIALEGLSYQLVLWKKNYLFTSPIEGTVSFTNVWADHQYVVAGETVMSIVPMCQEKIIGKMEIPVNGSGKIKRGQQVNIKLDNYPFMEYGVIKGIITSISLVPINNNYIAEIELSNRLNSNYGIPFSFIQGMAGTAEIVIEDMSLFERILQPIRYAIKRK